MNRFASGKNIIYVDNFFTLDFPLLVFCVFDNAADRSLIKLSKPKQVCIISFQTKTQPKFACQDIVIG